MSYAYSKRTAGIAFGVAIAVTALPAFAADLNYPYPGPDTGPSRIDREERIDEQVSPRPSPPQAEGYYGPRIAAGPRFAPPPEECRTIVKRRIDADGEEIERRVRICDEEPYPRPRPHGRSSFYDPGPVPPGEVPDERW